MRVFITTDFEPMGGLIDLGFCDDNNGANSIIIFASKVGLLSDLTICVWKEIYFTVPGTVSAAFFVGMELQSGAEKDTVLHSIDQYGYFCKPRIYCEYGSPRLAELLSNVTKTIAQEA